MISQIIYTYICIGTCLYNIYIDIYMFKKTRSHWIWSLIWKDITQKYNKSFSQQSIFIMKFLTFSIGKMYGSKYFTASAYRISANPMLQFQKYYLEWKLACVIGFFMRTKVHVHCLHLWNINFRFHSAPKVHFELIAITSYYNFQEYFCGMLYRKLVFNEYF